MSERARQLAEQINQYEEDCRRKEELQLHWAGVLHAKADDFWQKLISTFKEAYTHFNDALRECSAFRIEHFNDPRGQGSVRLGREFTRQLLGARPNFLVVV